ncbi:redoxin domain-containing protein [Kribbella sp. NPDC050124]|uniref:redoxin domain-containing protein n=1 Tax=Kribbella sp. NPDC050124 TaxID=3364114 RepID=UPI0037B18846
MPVRRLTSATALVALLPLTACGADAAEPSGQAGQPAATSPSRAGQASATTPSAVATASVPRSPAGSASASASAAVPEALRFSGTTLDGMTFDGATLAGKPAVLWFWAPWCPKCRAQAAETAKVAQEYQGKATIVGVAGLDDPEAMRGFVVDQNVGGFAHLSDEAGDVWERFAVTEQSTYVVLDAAGNKVFAGNLPAGKGLSDKLAELVG